jgi:predicted O-methyltransferase YrrM
MEILSLLKILADLRPKAVIEIGTASGGTLFLWTRVADSEAIIISIDLPGGPFGGGYPAWRIPLYRSFALGNQKIYLLRADSHRESTLNKVRKILGSSKVDFLFIDGDHSYEGVKKDFEMYGGLVEREGAIAFHDIVPGPPEHVGGVPRFWKEIKQKFRHIEIVESWSRGGYGIGVIFV